MSATDEADATRAIDAAARKSWEDYREEKRAGGWYVPPAFDELDKPAQRNIKEQVLPIVWAALEVVPSASEVRAQVALELEKHASGDAARSWGGSPGEQRGFVGGLREGSRVARGEVIP